MMTDFRELCSELLQALDEIAEYKVVDLDWIKSKPLKMASESMRDARAALDETKPIVTWIDSLEPEDEAQDTSEPVAGDDREFVLRKMPDNEEWGRFPGWYLNHDEFCCEIRNENGKWTVYFVDKVTEQEVFGESPLKNNARKKLMEAPIDERWYADLRNHVNPRPIHSLTESAPLLWLLWNHQGAGSPVGQHIRRYLGMSQFQRMTAEEIAAAKRYICLTELAQWKHLSPATQTSAPIPVCERLPEPEDCDVEGRCWVGYSEQVDMTGDIDVEYNPSWELCKVHPQDEVWLPFQSIPLPNGK